MDKGIVIYAFKKAAYGKLAYNLAVSLKHHSPEIPICLIHDDLAMAHLRPDQMRLFDHSVIMAREDLYDDHKFTPGKAKILGYKYFPFKQNMIIDADSLCIRPVEPLFEKCRSKPVYSQSTGTWTETAKEWTCQWMPLEDCKHVFDLPASYRLFEINSSFMLVNKGKEAQSFYEHALENYFKGLNHPKLRKWGGGFPDELALNIAFAQTGLSPNFDELKIDDINNIIQTPVFFSTTRGYQASKDGEAYFFLGCFGGRNFTSKTIQAQYDAYMRMYADKMGYIHQWKCHLLMKDKHVNVK